MKQSKFTNENLTTKQRLIKDFIIGAASQVAALFCCTPLQRYQMLLIQQENIKYKSHPKTLLRIWLDTVEGINNLWRSHPDDLKYIFSTGLLFTINGYYKRIIPYESAYLSGALAGATHLFLIYPFILTKLKLQEPQYKKILLYENNFLAQLIRIGKIQGFLSLYKGFWVSATSASIYKGIYFGGYDHIQKYLKEGFFDNIITKLVISYVITTFAEIVSYPFEKSVKNKLNKQYFSQLAEVVGKYRTIKASLVIVFYGEFFQLYEKIMHSFILDRNDQIQI